MTSVERVGWTADWRWEQKATFVVRFAAVSFFVLATAIYARLWNAHPVRPEPDDGARCCVSDATLRYCGSAGAAVLVWSLLGCVVYYGDPNYVWHALAA